MDYTIEFKKSNKTLKWNNRFESILELAEESGIDIEYECQLSFLRYCSCFYWLDFCGYPLFHSAVVCMDI